jgi:hypothetical protein
MRMKNDIFYEPLDGDNYQRIVTSLESEIAQLKGGGSLATSQGRRKRAPSLLANVG